MKALIERIRFRVHFFFRYECKYDRHLNCHYLWVGKLFVSVVPFKPYVRFGWNAAMGDLNQWG